MKLSNKQRREWVKESIQKAKVAEIDPPAVLGKYQGKILGLLQKEELVRKLLEI